MVSRRVSDLVQQAPIAGEDFGRRDGEVFGEAVEEGEVGDEPAPEGKSKKDEGGGKKDEKHTPAGYEGIVTWRQAGQRAETCEVLKTSQVCAGGLGNRFA